MLKAHEIMIFLSFSLLGKFSDETGDDIMWIRNVLDNTCKYN